MFYPGTNGVKKTFLIIAMAIITGSLLIAFWAVKKEYSERKRIREIISDIQDSKQKGDNEEIIKLVEKEDEIILANKQISKEYDRAIKNEMNHALIKADRLIEEEEYEKAREVISEAENLIGEAEEFDDYLVKINQEECLSKMKGYLDAKKYKEGLKDIQDNYAEMLNTSNSSIETSYKKLVKGYKRQIIDNAAKAYRDSGYKEAEEIINDALVIIEDDELEKKVAYYHNLAPVSLSSLEVFSYGNSDEYNCEFDKYKEDRYHNEYTHSFSIETDDKVTFYLDKKYGTFKGIIACPEGYMPKSNLSDVVITIYGDDKRLFTSDPSGPETKPQSFNIDISGVEKLSIESECQEALNIWSDWGMYGTIFNGVVVPSP